MQYDIGEIFVFEMQDDLKRKVKERDESLRVIAIPRFSMFFKDPITLEKAIEIYCTESRKRRNGTPVLKHREHRGNISPNATICDRDVDPRFSNIMKTVSTAESHWTNLLCNDSCIQMNSVETGLVKRSSLN